MLVQLEDDWSGLVSMERGLGETRLQIEGVKNCS